MAHAKKKNIYSYGWMGRVHLNRPGASVQSTTGSRGVRISGSYTGYTMFRGSVKGTGYPLHSHISPSLPLSCVTVCHHISTGVYSAFVVILLLRRVYQGGMEKTRKKSHFEVSENSLFFCSQVNRCFTRPHTFTSCPLPWYILQSRVGKVLLSFCNHVLPKFKVRPV